MEIHKAVEQLKSLILECDLPRTDMGVFGIKCPYCGKSDRIHRLEPPEALVGVIDPAAQRQYRHLWRQLNPSEAQMGICKFCLNPLELMLSRGHARALDHA